MTNFAKKVMMEQNMIPIGVASEGAPWRQNTAGSTFDDDYEPVRPSMTDSSNRYPPKPPLNIQSSNRMNEDDESFEDNNFKDNVDT